MTLQIEGSDVPLCGAVREKGDPQTLQTCRFVCDLAAGHVGGHEGCDQFRNRLGWPSSRDDRKAVA